MCMFEYMHTLKVRLLISSPLYPIVFALSFFITGCNSSTNKSQIASQNVSWSTKYVECSWPNRKELDTALANGINYKISIHCQDTINYIDTIKSPSECIIRKWKAIQYKVESNLYEEPLIITKANFRDSLKLYLLNNGFLTPPSDINFNPGDSSINVTSFIGMADSDVGELYTLQISISGRTKVIAVNPVKFGID